MLKINFIRSLSVKTRTFLRANGAPARRFFRANGANVAMMFGLSLVPLLIATGAGVDFARGVMVHQRMMEGLDAAALAVGNTTSKPSSCADSGSAGQDTASNTCYSLRQTAQQYFDQNYDHTQDSNYGAPTPVSITIVGQAVTLGTTLPLKLTLLGITGIGVTSPTVSASSTVVWGQTKLWVSLVLDNTGSMSQGDSNGTKIAALQSASHALLGILQNAAANAGDVQVAIIPFAKDVNIGTSFVNSTAIDWADWSAEPRNASGSADKMVSGDTVGPGDACPYTRSSDGFGCVKSPASSSTTSTVPSSGTYKGYICPGVMQTASASSGLGGHYFNGCYTSASLGTKLVSSGSNATCNGYTNCSCSGSYSSTKCYATTYTYTWKVNATSTWTGCIEDRNKKNDNGATNDFDTLNTTPSSGSGSLFPAENSDNCPATAVQGLSYDWTALGNEIDAMSANGSTNQTVGLAHGWQALTSGALYSAGSLPANTSEFIILLSDGLNTQDRWYGDGSNQSTSVDTRMALACTNAKSAGIVIYALFVDIGGTQGNSTVLQNCATDSSKYYDLTSTSQISTAFSDIAQKITNLRVSQ